MQVYKPAGDMSIRGSDERRERLKDWMHTAPWARGAFDHGGLPAGFAIEDIGIPAGVFRLETVAYLPGAVYFPLFVKSGVQAQLEAQ